MLRTTTLIVFAIALSVLCACRENETPHVHTKEQPAKTSASESLPAPQWSSSRIAVQHFAPAAAAITCDGGLQTKNHIVCGPTGMAAEVDSKFLGRSGKADVYEITIITRMQKSTSLKPGPVTKLDTIKVSYEGTKLVIFEDDRKRVILYPETDGLKTASGEHVESE